MLGDDQGRPGKFSILTRCGPNNYLDFFGELSKLQQTGSVEDYQNQFQKLLAKSGSVPQTRQVSLFVSGLQANKPTTLSESIGLARLFEARDKSQVFVVTPTTTQGKIPVRQLTTLELQERKKQGLCFHCDEKFRPAHHCKNLFMITPVIEEKDEELFMETNSPQP